MILAANGVCKKEIMLTTKTSSYVHVMSHHYSTVTLCHADTSACLSLNTPPQAKDRPSPATCWQNFSGVSDLVKMSAVFWGSQQSSRYTDWS